MKEILETIVIFIAVIDPIGSVPVFIAVTRRHEDMEKRSIAIRAVAIAGGVLLFFVLVGQVLLEAMAVPLSAFQVAGGIVLFLFALTMIFGESKPEEEVNIVRCGKETAVFPLAIPSIASPGAMMAVVVLTDNHRFSVLHQARTTAILFAVLLLTLLLLLTARWIYKWVGEGGASVISRVMGMILCAVAVTHILGGVKDYFKL